MKYIPVIATEIEFYLHNSMPEQALAIIKEECEKAKIEYAAIEKERGREQYEISLKNSKDVEKIIHDTELFKCLMKERFTGADFSAKPLADDYGSGLHIHVHLEDGAGNNLFYKDEEFSDYLLYAIGGLLQLMNNYMIIFAPNKESYARFLPKSNAPTTISWGINNRTTAIRLPNKPMNNKHIEHRVAGSDADIKKVIAAILTSIDYGIANKCDAAPPIYGDASLAQYNLPKLVGSLEEARVVFKDF